MVNNIILVGFMGTGKTTVGTVLANKLNWKFVDQDSRIEAAAGMTIPQIFDKHGEEWFRDQESAVLTQILQGSKQVISTGGGAVLRPQNREAMLQNGYVVALHASVGTIEARVSQNDGRPLLKGERRARIEALLESRKGAYDFAHFKLDTTHQSPNKLAEQIISKFRQA